MADSYFIALGGEQGRFDGQPPQWAAGRVAAALEGAGYRPAAEADADLVVHACLSQAAEAREWLSALGIQAPTFPEGLVLAKLPGRHPTRVVAVGTDPRGLVYALCELADRIRHGERPDQPDDLDTPLVLSSRVRQRSISRCFSSEIEDKAWFYDREYWRSYLDMLIDNRFNRFALTFGMTYNYPFDNRYLSDVYLHFAYPFLVSLPEYGVSAVGLSAEEQRENLEILKFVGREAGRRGLDFQLAVWTHGYDFADAVNATYKVVGISAENHAPYCRDALYTILQEVPEISGVTFRAHVESGIPEGSYAFWRTVFQALPRTGRRIGIDLHAKGVDPKLIDIALETGMPVNLSPKYLAEHLGLPYNQSSIRQREMPPRAPVDTIMSFSEGSRKFVRYSYGDLLGEDRKYTVSLRIWPGTQRVLLWGDPTFAGAYGQHSTFAGMIGVELCEPLSYKGRMGSSVPGARHNYLRTDLVQKFDWLKYAYQYRIWGQCVHDPLAPRDGWMRFLRSNCGSAADACERAMAQASRVLPLITLTHGPSGSNHNYWPEVYDNMSMVHLATPYPYAHDVDPPARFGCAPVFDPQLFSTAAEFAVEATKGPRSRRFTPLDVAQWLDRMADGAVAAASEARRSDAGLRPEVRRIVIDAEILAGIAQFFAEKFKSACAFELYVVTGDMRLHARALDHYRRAAEAWKGIVQAADGIYHPDLSYGPMPWTRGSWATRLPAILRDVDDLACWRADPRSVDPGLAETAWQALEAWSPVNSLDVRHTPPVSFTPGSPIAIRCRLDPGLGNPILHYRHVNQAENWFSVPMADVDGVHVASIPAAYTKSPFSMIYYLSAEEGGRPVLSPGLHGDLSNQPYHLVRHDGNEPLK